MPDHGNQFLERMLVAIGGARRRHLSRFRHPAARRRRHLGRRLCLRCIRPPRTHQPGLRCAEAESMRKPMIRLSFRTPLMLAASYALFAAAPPGWFLAGSAPRSYETGVDQTVTYAGMPSAVLKSVSPVPPQGFGTMMQTIQAGDYRGKRIRFSAEVKSDSVADWAGLWMRVDEGKQVTAFDNMQHRPIKGSTNWNPYTVVLDV